MMKKVLFYLFLTLFISSAIYADEVSWINGTNRPAAWTIDQSEVGQDDVISFSGPVGPLINGTYGMTYLGGTPVISVDEENKIVELTVQGPPPQYSSFAWAPVCGLSGEFGPLPPGEWTFLSNQPHIVFEIPFTVTGGPEGHIYYVDKDTPGSNHDGQSWNSAFTNLQDALEIAIAGDTIFVAQGTYKPDRGGSAILHDRMATFAIAPGVVLIGSFAGYGHTDPDVQDVDTYKTILSGDLNGDDAFGILNRQDNSYQVVRVAGGMEGKVTIDGFTITAGKADGPDLMNSGAGLDVDGSEVMLVNTTVSVNESGFGGGISCKNSVLDMWNCIVTGNHAQIYGGGLYSYASDVNMTNCLMAGNAAFQATTTGGSAIYNLGGNLNIMNCTLADNFFDSSPPEGKAITSYMWKFPSDKKLVISNSILYNTGDEILANHPATVFVSYSDVQGGWAGIGNFSKNPQFKNPGHKSVEGQWTDGDYSLKSNSPCIDKGNNSLLPLDEADLDKDGDVTEALPIDLDGNARVKDNVVEMGAYERPGEILPSPSQPLLQDGIWYNVPSKIQGNPRITLQSPLVSYTISLNFQATLSLEVIPTSAAGGDWSAWFYPNPGVVGPGSVTFRLMVQGKNIDIGKLSCGYQQLAQLRIYVQPIGTGDDNIPPDDGNVTPPDDPDNIPPDDGDVTPPDDPDNIPPDDGDVTPPDDPDNIPPDDGDVTPPDDPDNIPPDDGDVTPPDDPDNIPPDDGDVTPPDDPDNIPPDDGDVTPPDDPDNIPPDDGDVTPPDDPDNIPSDNPDNIPPDDPDNIGGIIE